jgi:hypothetical protein
MRSSRFTHASTREEERLADDTGRTQLLLGERAIRFEDQGYGLAKVGPSLL